MAELAIHRTGILAAGDELVLSGFSAGVTLTRFAPLVEVAPTGSNLVLRLQGASGAAVTPNLEATILAGAKLSSSPPVGAVPIAAGGSIIVRVQSGPSGGSAASHLGGYFEFSAAGGAGGVYFATVAQIKAFAGITVATYDADLDVIAAGVTSAMQAYMRRELVLATYSSELHSLSVASPLLLLDHRPLVSVSSVLIDGDPVTDYQIDAKLGALYREAGWPAGRYHLAVTYQAGFATIPPAIASAALEQARAQWSRHAFGGNRHGEAQRAEASGGSTAFVVDAWYPGVRETMDAFRRSA